MRKIVDLNQMYENFYGKVIHDKELICKILLCIQNSPQRPLLICVSLPTYPERFILYLKVFTFTVRLDFPVIFLASLTVLILRR